MEEKKTSVSGSGGENGLSVTAGRIEKRILALSALSPPAIANLLDRCRLAQTIIDQVKLQAKALLAADPSAIPGWGLSDGRVSKPVINPQVCFDRFAALGGKLPDFLECIDVVKGRLEEKVSKVTDSKGKALKTQLTALYEGITEEKRSQPSLERVGGK